MPVTAVAVLFHASDDNGAVGAVAPPRWPASLTLGAERNVRVNERGARSLQLRFEPLHPRFELFHLSVRHRYTFAITVQLVPS